MTLGQSLKAISKRKRIGAYKIGKALDVYHTTVYDWWNDKYRPSSDNLAAYAALMEVSVEEIMRETGDEHQRTAVADAVLNVLVRVGEGESPADAFTAVTGGTVPASRRAAVREIGERVKQILADLAGIDWDRATPAVRERVLQELRAELLGTVAEP